VSELVLFIARQFDGAAGSLQAIYPCNRRSYLVERFVARRTGGDAVFARGLQSAHNLKLDLLLRGLCGQADGFQIRSAASRGFRPSPITYHYHDGCHTLDQPFRSGEV